MVESSNIPSRDEVVSRAEALSGLLGERSVEAREARAVPEAVIAAYVDAGLHRLTRPLAHGGWDAGLDLQVETTFAYGRGDAAQGWVLSGFGDNTHLVSAFADDAQDEVWGAGATGLTAGHLAVGGEAVSHNGDYVLSGRWSGVAGIDHADWLLGKAKVANGEGSSELLFLAPKAELGVVDDWQATGIEGTGAKSVVLDSVRIPAHRVVTEGAALGRTSSLALAAVPLGVANAMIENFVALCLDTQKRGRRVSDNFATALRLAESKADVDAAVLALTDAAARTVAAVSSGEGLSAEQRALNSLRAGHSALVAARAADRIFAAAGAKAILLTNPVQRYLLDIHALAAQDIFAWDRTASRYGLQRITPQG